MCCVFSTQHMSHRADAVVNTTWCILTVFMKLRRCENDVDAGVFLFCSLVFNRHAALLHICFFALSFDEINMRRTKHVMSWMHRKLHCHGYGHFFQRLLPVAAPLLCRPSCPCKRMHWDSNKPSRSCAFTVPLHAHAWQLCYWRVEIWSVTRTCSLADSITLAPRLLFIGSW
jgi:hypothetical protein